MQLTPVRVRALPVDLMEQVRPNASEWLRPQPAQRDLVPQRHLSPYKANREAPRPIWSASSCYAASSAGTWAGEFASAHYEADDIIGTLAARSRAAGCATYW